MGRSRAASILLAVGSVVVACTSEAVVEADIGIADAAAADPSGVDTALTRDDVDCSPEAVGADFVDFTTVHLVVDGILGAPCLGEEDPTVLEAWDILVTIAPAAARADLGLFGGFADDGTGDDVTLAFVNVIDDDGTLFQMSVNLDAFGDDADESYLTVAHEFSHVFTQLPSELDRSPEAAENCVTYDNGEGCFVDGSLVARYIEAFWPDDLLADIDPFAEATIETGEERCDLHDDFLGPYAATNPEEDFGETFSAFVFGVDTAPGIAEKIDWMADQPGLVEIRDRAAAAGLTQLEADFERCG